jgi:hypothetical protein
MATAPITEKRQRRTVAGAIELAFQFDFTQVIHYRLDLACTSCQLQVWRRENMSLSTEKPDFTLSNWDG